MDYQPELAFDATKILSFFRAFYEELNWKFSGTVSYSEASRSICDHFPAWTDGLIERCWPQIYSEHDDVGISYLLLQNRP